MSKARTVFRHNPPRTVVLDDQGRILREFYHVAMPLDRCRRLAERYVREYNQKAETMTLKDWSTLSGILPTTPTTERKAVSVVLD